MSNVAPAVVCCILLLGTGGLGGAPSPQPASLASNTLFVVELQTALARQGISPGPIDGMTGGQTEAALRAFQRKHGLRTTGVLDEGTRIKLLPMAVPLFTNYVVTSNDIGRLLTVPATWLGKSLAPRLDYESALELVAEKSLSHHKLILALNPQVNWTNIIAGTVVTVPNAHAPAVSNKAAFVQVRLGDRVLQAFGADSNLLAHFPCSIGQRVDKRPVGQLNVTVLVVDPNYTFDPTVFPESAEAQQIGRKLILPAGPNNPVGTAWVGLDRPGYGIHGTPLPEKVGRTESHGCFRLANWNAEYLLKLLWVGAPVIVQP